MARIMDRRRLLRTVVAGALASGSGSGSGAASAAEDLMQSFASGGVPIAVEWFAAEGPAAKAPATGAKAPATGAKAPAVLLLHGADGLRFAEGYRLGARLIAAAGIHVAFVHYLDRTGDGRVSFSRLKASAPAWLETVRDALAWVAVRAEVDPDRLGIVGISLGAALALEVAAGNDRVKAVVDYFGPMPDSLPTRGLKLPPVLILHGDQDPIVSVDHARALETLFRRDGTPYEIEIYPGQGHGFTGAAQLASASRVSAFLRRYLVERAS